MSMKEKKNESASKRIFEKYSDLTVSISACQMTLGGIIVEALSSGAKSAEGLADLRMRWMNGPYSTCKDLEAAVAELTGKLAADAEFTEKQKKAFEEDYVDGWNSVLESAKKLDHTIMCEWVPPKGSI